MENSNASVPANRTTSPYANYRTSGQEHSVKPLTFPEADREFQQRESGIALPMPTSRYIPPVSFTKSANIEHGKDITDSDNERRSSNVIIPLQNRVPIASPESVDAYDEINKVESDTAHPHETAHTRLPPLSIDPIRLGGLDETRYFISWRTLLELIAMLAAMIPMVVAPHLGAYQRGFFCNDPDLMYPFREGTVKPWLLYLISLSVPFVTVLIGEFCRFHVSKTGYGNMEVKYRFWRKGRVIPPTLVSITRILVLFLYGLLITKSVTDIAKYAVGRLRPHFLDACQPDMDQIMRNGGCTRYITDAVCKNMNNTDAKVQYRLRDSRLSFLSGHASIGFYSMFFVIYYLESRLRWMHLRYCKAILQFGLFLMAALTGMSRISDHKHHWTDVFAGALLGIVVSTLIVFVVGGFFNDSNFLRFKLVSMLHKLDWTCDEGGQFAQLLTNCKRNGNDPGVLRKLKHVTRYQHNSPKTA